MYDADRHMEGWRRQSPEPCGSPPTTICRVDAMARMVAGVSDCSRAGAFMFRIRLFGEQAQAHRVNTRR